jgi:hypothetical protein
VMERDGTVHRRGVAAFRLVSYISRKDLRILAEQESGYADGNSSESSEGYSDGSSTEDS